MARAKLSLMSSVSRYILYSTLLFH